MVEILILILKEVTLLTNLYTPPQNAFITQPTSDTIEVGAL